MERIGYVRVSSVEQNEDRQVVEIQKLNVDRIFIDKVSGKDTDRPQLQEMLSYIRQGDVLIVHSMDRLARNLKDLLCLVEDLVGKGVSIQFIKENLTFDASTDNPMSKMILSMVGAFAEFERNMIKSRQKEGIALAKARGAYKGRQREITDEEIRQIEELIKQGVPKAKIARSLGFSRGTIYNYIK